MPDALFFYGVLRPELASGRMAELVALLGDPRPATVAGRLYAVPDARGHYPVMIAGEDGGRVRGIIMQLGAMFGGDALAELDAFEGFDPAAHDSSDYIRHSVRAELADGTPLAADAYWWNRAVAADFIPIAHGDFARYLAESGARTLPG